MIKKIKIISIILIMSLLYISCMENVNAAKKTKGYGFIYKKNNYKITDKALKLKKALGKSKNYKKSKSCAFNGEDYVYNYNDLILKTYTNKKGGEEYILGVEFKTKNVSTDKGIKLGSSKKDMINKYGKTSEKFGVYTYKKGKNGINFVVENNKIVEIEYFLINR